MQEITLDVQIREKLGKQSVKSLRRDDFVPAVVYGGQKHGPTAIKVEKRSYEKIMRHHKGESVVFHINVHEGEKKLRDYSAIVKEEQHEPVSDKLLHIDFARISLTEELEVKVQVNVKGEAIGVKRDGGSLDHHIWELDVVCLPTNIPTGIDVDISELEIGNAIHVKDIALPSGVKTKHDPDAIIVSVVPPMKDEEETESDADAEPEVIKEKKDKPEEASEEKKEDKAEGA